MYIHMGCIIDKLIIYIVKVTYNLKNIQYNFSRQYYSLTKRILLYQYDYLFIFVFIKTQMVFELVLNCLNVYLTSFCALSVHL